MTTDDSKISKCPAKAWAEGYEALCKLHGCSLVVDSLGRLVLVETDFNDRRPDGECASFYVGMFEAIDPPREQVEGRVNRTVVSNPCTCSPAWQGPGHEPTCPIHAEETQGYLPPLDYELAGDAFAGWTSARIVKHCCVEHDKRYPGVQPSATAAFDDLLLDIAPPELIELANAVRHLTTSAVLVSLASEVRTLATTGLRVIPFIVALARSGWYTRREGK